VDIGRKEGRKDGIILQEQEISKDVVIWHKEILSEIPSISLPLEFHPLI
jgi:hypothetical protein